MALTTNQIISAVRRKILEETSDIISDETILMYANDTYLDLKIKTFSTEQIKTATVIFTAGVGTLPSDFGTLYGPGYKNDTDRTPYEEKSIADFDRDLHIEGITVEAGQIKVHPITVPSLIIKYWPSYAMLSVSQNPEINEYFHKLIVLGAIAQAHEDLQNEALSEYYGKKYEEKLLERTGALSNYQEENQRGGTMFNHVKLI